MLDAMTSRGPDYEGKQFSQDVLLGHRLLRVLPCPLSTQPMRMAFPALSIVFNGEIYNYKELRNDLRRQGHTFRTDTDTEVILAIYRQHGTAGFRFLKGMFAFIIHDEEQHRVITARDRLGQKPLYYFKNGSHLFICSSFSAIQFLPKVSHRLNDEAIADYVWTLNVIGENTLLEGVLHHPAGSAISWEAGTNRVLEEIAFASCRFDAPSVEVSLSNYVDEAEDRLASALMSMTNDVPTIACHLSGGIDSSLLSLMCAEAVGQRLRLFTCSFDWLATDVRKDEEHFNEYQYAQTVARITGAPHYEVRISADHYRQAMQKVFDLLEEPKGNAAISHSVLADVVSGYSRICISGEGADELFGGYLWKLAVSQLENSQKIEEGYFSKVTPCGIEVMRKLVTNSDSEWNVRRRIADRLDLGSGRAPIDAIMDLELQSFLRYLLIQSDKIAGHYSIEGRYPFLHDDVADFAFRLPQQLRFSPNVQPGKVVLTRLLQRWLPIEMVSRPKVGFVGPEGSWYGSELWGLITSLLSPSARIAKYISTDALETVLIAHRAGNLNARKLIWGLLSLEHWLARSQL